MNKLPDNLESPPAPRHKVQVEIYGNQYHLFSDDNPQRIEELARRVDENMRSIARMNPGLAATKIAILTALNFAEQADQKNTTCNLIAKHTDNLLELLCKELDE